MTKSRTISETLIMSIEINRVYILNRDTGSILYLTLNNGNPHVSFVRNGYSLQYLNIDEIILILRSLIENNIYKDIILLDLNRSIVPSVIEKIKSICTKIKLSPYISSNDHDMCLMFCYLDKEKILNTKIGSKSFIIVSLYS